MRCDLYSNLDTLISALVHNDRLDIHFTPLGGDMGPDVYMRPSLPSLACKDDMHTPEFLDCETLSSKFSTIMSSQKSKV